MTAPFTIATLTAGTLTGANCPGATLPAGPVHGALAPGAPPRGGEGPATAPRPPAAPPSAPRLRRPGAGGPKAGSKTPPEIAFAPLAGVTADGPERRGAFHSPKPPCEAGWVGGLPRPAPIDPATAPLCCHSGGLVPPQKGNERTRWPS